MGPTRRLDMRQKIGILIFIAGGFVLWYLIFTNEGQELGADFVEWIEDIVKF